MTTIRTGESSIYWTILLAMTDQTHEYYLGIVDIIANPMMDISFELP